MHGEKKENKNMFSKLGKGIEICRGIKSYPRLIQLSFMYAKEPLIVRSSIFHVSLRKKKTLSIKLSHNTILEKIVIHV